MPIHDPPSAGSLLAASDMRVGGRGWLAQIDALGSEACAIGLVWPSAPAAEDLAATLGAVLNRGRTGYLDPRPALLPWQSVSANLVLGTGIPPGAALTERMLRAAGLSALATRHPQALSPFQRLVLGLGRAMLHHPGLLVIGYIHRHPAAAGQMRALTRIEAELGDLTGCRRLHVVDRLPHAETFCDIFLQVTP